MTHPVASARGTNPTSSESIVGISLMVSVTVSDLQKSLAWYRDIVGFTVDREHERDGTLQAVALKAGNVRLLLGRDDGAKGANRKRGEAISLAITTQQNLDALATAIKARGGILESEPKVMPWGLRMFRMKDPDGFLWAISAEP